MKQTKNKDINDDVVKALHKANREIEMERNGFRWMAVNRPHKNKKKYQCRCKWCFEYIKESNRKV